MSSFSAPSSGSNQEQFTEEKEIEFLQLKDLNQEVLLKVAPEPLDPQKAPGYVSLLAVSNQYGYFVAGTNKGFIFDTTDALKKSIKNASKQSIAEFKAKAEVTVSNGAVQHIRLSADELTLLVGTSTGDILLYDIPTLNQQNENTSPYKTISLGNSIRDIRPNPLEKPTQFAVLLNDKNLKFVDFSGDIKQIGSSYTAICWSQKGKQIACGNTKSEISLITCDGTTKGTIQAPPSIVGTPNHVENICWLENKVFNVVYNIQSDDPEESHEYSVYIISTEDKSSIIYTKLEDPCAPWGVKDRGSHYYIELIKNWGDECKYIMFCASTASADVGVVGCDQQKQWNTWVLDETTRASVPLSRITDEDTAPIGLAIDLTASEALPPLNPEVSETPVEPVPILILMDSDGMLSAFHCLNIEAANKGNKYEGMMNPNQIPAPNPSKSALSTTGVTTTSHNTLGFGSNVKPAFGVTGFGTPSTPVVGTSVGLNNTPAASSSIALGGNVFGANKSENKSSTPVFGSSSFGSNSSFGALSKPSSIFGATSSDDSKPLQTEAAKPTFEGFGTKTQSSTPLFGNKPDESSQAPKVTPVAEPPKPSFGGFSNPPQPAAVGKLEAKGLGNSTFGSNTTTEISKTQPAMASFNVTSGLKSSSSPASKTPSNTMISKSSNTTELKSFNSTPRSTSEPSNNSSSNNSDIIAEEFQQTYDLFSKELALIEKSVEESAANLSSLRNPSNKVNPEFSDVDGWTFGDLKDVVQLTHDLSSEAVALKEKSLITKKQVLETQGEILKIEMKREEAARFLRAKEDPDYAKLVKVRQLGPEHSDNQQKLRRNTQIAQDRIEELEGHLVFLKNSSQYSGSKKGFEPPSLDTIFRTIRNISSAVRDHSNNLEDLTSGLNRLNLSASHLSSSSRIPSTPLKSSLTVTSKTPSTPFNPFQSSSTLVSPSPRKYYIPTVSPISQETQMGRKEVHKSLKEALTSSSRQVTLNNKVLEASKNTGLDLDRKLSSGIKKDSVAILPFRLPKSASEEDIEEHEDAESDVYSHCQSTEESYDHLSHDESLEQGIEDWEFDGDDNYYDDEDEDEDDASEEGNELVRPSSPGFSFSISSPTKEVNSEPVSKIAATNPAIDKFDSGVVKNKLEETTSLASTGFSFASKPADPPAAPASTGFSFASKPADSPTAPASTGFSFASKPADSPAAPASTGFSFASKPADPPATPASTGFSFASKPTDSPTVPAVSIESSSDSKPADSSTAVPISTGLSFTSKSVDSSTISSVLTEPVSADKLSDSTVALPTSTVLSFASKPTESSTPTTSSELSFTSKLAESSAAPPASIESSFATKSADLSKPTPSATSYDENLAVKDAEHLQEEQIDLGSSSKNPGILDNSETKTQEDIQESNDEVELLNEPLDDSKDKVKLEVPALTTTSTQDIEELVDGTSESISESVKTQDQTDNNFVTDTHDDTDDILQSKPDSESKDVNDDSMMSDENSSQDALDIDSINICEPSLPPSESGKPFSSSSTPFASNPTSSPFGIGNAVFGSSFTTSAPASNTSTFGSTTTAPAFGSTTPFGSAGKPTTFGSPTVNTPTFGSAVNSTPNTPVFGSTSFGTSAPAFNSVPPSAPAFGSTSSLGSNTSTFGSTSSFGSNKPVFGSNTSFASTAPAFGATTPLGSSSFGASNTLGSSTTGGPTTFGSTSPLGNNLSTFGSSTTFSSFRGNTGFGQSTSPSKPFGQGFAQANNSFGSLANQGNVFEQEANKQSGANVFGGSTTNSFGGTNSNSFGQSNSSNLKFTDYR